MTVWWYQRLAIFAIALGLMTLIFELVRKRRLREEYSWLWLLTGVAVLGLAVVPAAAAVEIAEVFGSKNPTAAIFFFAFIFVALLCLQFSVRLSRMTEHVKTLAQKIALLEQDLEREREVKDR
jgi:hypothetical protein